MSKPIGIYRRRGYTFLGNRTTGMAFQGVNYGGWDVACRLCHWSGTDPYPTGRETAFQLAAAHLREAHGG